MIKYGRVCGYWHT